MTKAKTGAAEAETPPVTTPEGQDTVAATDQAPEGQDTVAATDQAPEGQDTWRNEGELVLEAQDAAGADAQPLERISEEEKQRLAEEAEADAAAAAEAERLAAEAAEAPGPNLRVLNHLTKQVDMLNHTGLRQGLVDEMRDLYGANIELQSHGGWTVEIEGVAIDPADSLENALTLWANAARRAILEATA